MSEKQFDILYSPKIGYEKKYDTTGIVEGNFTEPTVKNLSSKKDFKDLINKVKEIEIEVLLLPPDIQKAIAPIIKGAKYIASQITEEDYNNGKVKPESIIKIETIDKEVPEIQDDEDYPEIFSPNIPEYLINIDEMTKSEAIEKEYVNTLGNMLKDYLNSIQEKINSYFTNVTMMSAESKLKDLSFLAKKYEMKTTAIKNKDLYHVSDSIIRSQIIMDQKLRMFKKLFSYNETVNHVRACKVAKDLRRRYYEEEQMKNSLYLDVTKNTMLMNSQMAYDRKYKENLFNLYKYMNSSVILINECLDMYIQEAQAKIILVKEEGIKL